MLATARPSYLTVAKYRDEYVSVCLSVCLLAYLENHTAELHQILCMLLMSAVARSSSGGLAIRYILPVL